MSNISPGTLYPKLRKLRESGDISESGNSKTYSITDKGKKRLTENGERIIQDSINFLPRLFKALVIEPLPFSHQLNFPKFPFFSDYRFLDDILSSSEFYCKNNVSQSEKNLDRLKERLVKEKEELKKQYEVQIEYIDKKIESINKMAKKCEDEKKNWKKIEIEEE